MCLFRPNTVQAAYRRGRSIYPAKPHVVTTKWNDNKVVIKKVDRVYELFLLQKLKHTNIITVIDSSMWSTGAYIVFEFAPGDLLSYMQRNRPEEVEVQCYFVQIHRAVMYIHSFSIIHADIKLDNCLLFGNNIVKLIDFGLASVVKPGQVQSRGCGTISYRAPETFLRSYCGFANDVWALGICLFAMLTGFFPFVRASGSDNCFKTTFFKKNHSIRSIFVFYNLPFKLSEDVTDLLEQVLCECDTRLGIDSIHIHRWMNLHPTLMS